MKKLRLVFFAIGGVAVIGLGVGLMMYYKPHKNYATSDPDVRITAKDFAAAFDADEVNANWAYVKGGKTILVTGVVSEISSSKDGIVDVILAGSDESGSVSCTMMQDQTAKAKTLRKGDIAHIKGQCTGRQELIEKQVIMIRCALSDER